MYKNEKASSPPVNNKVVDFCCGKIIMLLSDHPGKLFYQDSDSSIYILGEHLPDAEPKPCISSFRRRTGDDLQTL